MINILLVMHIFKNMYRKLFKDFTVSQRNTVYNVTFILLPIYFCHNQVPFLLKLFDHHIISYGYCIRKYLFCICISKGSVVVFCIIFSLFLCNEYVNM